MDDAVFSRRTFGIGAAFSLAGLALTGCTPDAGPSQAKPTGGEAGAYINKSMDFFFFVVLAESIKRSTEKLHMEFKSTDAKGDSSQQFNQAKSTLLQRPGFLVVNPVDSGAWAPIASQAKRDKLPIGAVDALVNDGEIDFQVAFDNREAGRMAAARTVELLKQRYNGQAQGQVFNGYGKLSSAAWNARKIGFEEEIGKYPDIRLISRPTEGSETQSREVAGATLAEFPNLDALHAPSDSLTRGMITAMGTAGRLKRVGEEGHVIVTTIDGEPQALGWLRDRIIDAPVSQDPVAYGEICVHMLTEYVAKGDPIPIGPYHNEKYYWKTAAITATENGPRMTIPPYIIGADSVDDPRQWANVVTKQWGMAQ